ncbi:unnamed protein product [Rhizophagus irregularis]|nr:unnamed protein product [Rhizophagus irregularis]CAB4408586.1 unnamed protein product [Rhizophagus irregularis]
MNVFIFYFLFFRDCKTNGSGNQPVFLVLQGMAERLWKLTCILVYKNVQTRKSTENLNLQDIITLIIYFVNFWYNGL